MRNDAAQGSFQNSDRDKYVGKMVERFRSFIYADNIQRCIVSIPGNAGIPVTGYLRRCEPRWRIPSHGGRLPYSRAHQVRFAWRDAEICEKVQSPFLSHRKSYFFRRGIRKEQMNCTARKGEELNWCINSGARPGSGF